MTKYISNSGHFPEIAQKIIQVFYRCAAMSTHCFSVGID